MAENENNVTAQDLLSRLKKGKEEAQESVENKTEKPVYFNFNSKDEEVVDSSETTFNGSFDSNIEETNIEETFILDSEEKEQSNKGVDNGDFAFLEPEDDSDFVDTNNQNELVNDDYQELGSYNDNTNEAESFNELGLDFVDSVSNMEDTDLEQNYDLFDETSDNTAFYADVIDNPDDNVNPLEDDAMIEEPSVEFYETDYSEYLENPNDSDVHEYVFDDNIIPDDDFFDNDPIENEEEIVEEEAVSNDIPEEFDPSVDFENLVAEVTGDTDVNELDESDISLAVALGMEDELTKFMDTDKANQLTEDYVADQEEWVKRKEKYGAGEYSDPSENAEIADKYRKRNTKAIIKLIISFALTVLLLVYENLPVIGLQFSGFLDPAVYPVVYVMIDLQIVFFAAALAISGIGDGLKSLFKFKPNINSIPAVLVIVSTIISIVMAIRTVPGVEPVMFNFPTVLSLFLVSLSEYLTVRREIFSFNIVSSRKPKYVMRHLNTRDSMLETEAVAGMELDSNLADEGDIIKIQKTDFVDGYFWHTNNKGTINNSYYGLAIAASICLGVLVAIYAAISKSASIISAFYATISAAFPASMVLIGCYPFYSANKQAYDMDSTIIGEGSVEEYSGVGVISFDDVNVFSSTAVKVRNVRLYNNSRIDKVLYYAASVFSATGGPLADVFEVATMETGHSESVEILETGNGYIEANVNGKNVLFGRASALANHGIVLPEDVMSDTTELPADCSVMYMIYQHKLVSKMVVGYSIDPDFEYILKQLTASGMCVCVKTFDPNIDEEMIYRQVRSGKYSLRVIKYKNTEEITKYTKNADGGIVSRDNTKSLLHTVAFCDKILSAKKTGFVIGVISSIVSAVAIGGVLVAGGFTGLHSIIPAALQLFWLIPTLITSKMIVR